MMNSSSHSLSLTQGWSANQECQRSRNTSSRDIRIVVHQTLLQGVRPSNNFELSVQATTLQLSIHTLTASNTYSLTLPTPPKVVY
eukprot:6479264-Amphidinium_carterae.1